MENNIEGKSKDIIRVLLGINIIFLLLAFFYKSLMITSTLINIIFLFSFFIIEKHGAFFGLMMQTQRSARGLNKLVGKLNGKISR